MVINRMSKRNAGVLIAGMALVAQVGTAAAGESDFPLGARQLREKAEPAMRSTYQSEHPSSQTTVSADFPLGARQLREKAEPPARSTYQSEHAGRQTGAENDSFPGGPSDEPWQLLPGQAAYFDRKSGGSAD